jgi:hypothetical protein
MKFDGAVVPPHKKIKQQIAPEKHSMTPAHALYSTDY